PHLLECGAEFCSCRSSLWEGACSRWRWFSQHLGCLTLRHREQAPSHRSPRCRPETLFNALVIFSITAARARLLWQLSPYTSKLCWYVSHKNKMPVKSSAAS
ncbi:hypothetical protein F0170_18425, partial [Pseudomonas sp. MAFF 730085]|nr:hypothetical protein [Pseudomonas kitaguniensis]